MIEEGSIRIAAASCRTVTSAVPLTSPTEARTVPEPFPVDVTTPSESTVNTSGALLSQVTGAAATG